MLERVGQKLCVCGLAKIKRGFMIARSRMDAAVYDLGRVAYYFNL
jgi:hypothetical protein